MATIRKRGNYWRAEVCVNRVRDSATFDTKGQANAWAAKRETELREGGAFNKSNRTLAEALIRYRDEVSPKHKGSEWEYKRINAIIRDYGWLVHTKLVDLSTDHFVRWRDMRLKEVTGNTVRRDVSVLSGVLITAKTEWKWCEHNPLTDLKKPPKPAPRDRRISDEETMVICEKLGFNEETPENYSQQIGLAFLFALETAMRVSEILGLTWDRVHLSARYVELVETKNGTKRHVPLSKRAIELLMLMQPIDRKRVFTVSNGTFTTLFRKARDKCNIQDLHFHDTRHEACTRLARRLEVLDLARMIGHNDLKSLMIYYNATATEIASRLD